MARYALVIGIATYDHFRNLSKAATDAEAIALLLEQHRYTVTRLPRKLMGENQWVTAPDKKLTAAELSRELKTFLRERATHQEALIYFAGHGFRVTDDLTDEEVGYLATSDSTKEGQNAIRVDALNILISKSELGSLVMLLDCCYAGTLIEQRSLLQPTQGIFSHKQNYCLIAACRDFERAREGEQHGIFTAAVLRGLSAENAANGEITSTDLVSFVSRILQSSGQEVIHAGMGQSIPLVAYQPTQLEGKEKSRTLFEEEQRLPAEQCQAYDLAQKMRAWFDTLGYRFESHEVWESDFFEWIINIPIRRNRYDRVLVRGISGEAGLKEMATLQQSVTQQRTDEGWLVTTRRISRAVRDRVEATENQQLGCYTFDELLDQDADFCGYLTWLETEIQQRQIEQRYVPLACTKEEIDPDTKQRIGISRYDERDGWIDGYIDLWLDDPVKEHLSVLGEFGTGKTWFAFHYAWKALQRYREAQQRGVERPRLPLVIPLRDYAKAVSVESLFSEFFFRKHEIPIPGYTAFEQLNRMGKLLLIFDGFDEMAARVDRQQMINNFWELAKVVVPGSKVILTCRTEHFPEAREGRALLNAELQASTKGLTGETPQFEVLELEKFTDTQIHQVLALQTQPETVNQVMTNAQLLDLARRPVMTELILEALPDIESGKPIDMSRVYLYAVRRKMERDIKAERTFTSLADKLYFLCELSWEMLSTDQMSINYRQFPDRIRRLFGHAVQEEKDLDHWHYDMMGQTMLIRNADGDYMPAHRSLLEFFVAYKFAAELGVLAPDFLELAQMRSNLALKADPQNYTWSDYFGHQIDTNDAIIPAPHLREFQREPIKKLRQTIGKSPLTKAVLDLLLPMLGTEACIKNIALSLVQDSKGKSIPEVGYVGGNILTALLKVNPLALEGHDLSESILLEADFLSASLRNVNLSNANVEKSIFPRSFGSIFAVAFDPQEPRIAVGDSNGEVTFWDIHSGRKIFTLSGHTDWVRALEFSTNGKILASASFDQTVKVWDTNTGQCTYTLNGHLSRLNNISNITDDNFLVSCSDDTTAKIWNINTGQCISTLHGHTGQVRAAALNTGNNIIVTGSNDGTVKVWDIKTGKLLKDFCSNAKGIRAVTMDAKAEILVAGTDKDISIWDLSTGVCLRILEGHSKIIRALVLSKDKSTLVSGSEDQTIRIWNLVTGKCLHILNGHSDWVRSVDINESLSLIVSGSDDRSIRFWDIKTGSCLKNLQGYTSGIRSIAIANNKPFLVSGSEDHVVRLWDYNTGTCLKSLMGHSGRVNALIFSSDSRFLVSTSYDRTIRFWDMESEQCTQILTHDSRGINAVALTPDDKTFISLAGTPSIKIWNVDTGECIQTINGHDDWLWSIAMSPDGKTFATASDDQTIKLWDIKTGNCLQTYRGHTNGVQAVAINPDGKTLVSGGYDQTIKIWNLKTGECAKTLEGHENRLSSVAIHPSGITLASGSFDRTVKIWNLNTGKCLHTLQGHTSGVRSVAFSSCDDHLASGSFDGTIRVWSTKKYECLRTLDNRLYAGLNITGIKGVTEAEKNTLKALGAVGN